MHVLFDSLETRTLGPLTMVLPDLASVNLLAMALTIAAGLGLLVLRMGLGTVLSASALIGLVSQLI